MQVAQIASSHTEAGDHHCGSSIFESISLFDTQFHKVTVQELIDYIVDCAGKPQKTIIGNLNVKAANLAYEKAWFRRFVNHCNLVFCDGFGVLLGAKLLGCNLDSSHRMTAPDYIEDLAIACARHNRSIFLLAGQPGVTDKAIAKLTAVAPDLRIEGHHGYFEKSGAENAAIVDRISTFAPDILYVGFGMPLQERWILDNIDRLDAKVFLPLGACLDFYTGTVYRGPAWMTDRGLEWLARLGTEPQRLWQRYIIGNPLFLFRIFKSYVANNWSKRRYRPSLSQQPTNMSSREQLHRGILNSRND